MTTSKLPPLLLVGCGKMGGALLAGWLEQGLTEAVVVEPHAPAAAAFAGRVTLVENPKHIPAGFKPAAVVLAIKPQEAAATLPLFRRFAGPETLFLSIMAGRNRAGHAKHPRRHPPGFYLLSRLGGRDGRAAGLGRRPAHRRWRSRLGG